MKRLIHGVVVVVVAVGQHFHIVGYVADCWVVVEAVAKTIITGKIIH